MAAAQSDARADAKTVAVTAPPQGAAQPGGIALAPASNGGPAQPPPRYSGALDPLLKLEGQPFGHYQIESLLGRGQSGLVFRAQDKKSGQAVTLKLLALDFPANDAELQRFIRALKLVAPLRHPQLVTLYAAGKTGPICWIGASTSRAKAWPR